MVDVCLMSGKHFLFQSTHTQYTAVQGDFAGQSNILADRTPGNC